MNLRLQYLLLTILILALTPFIGLWIAKFSVLKISLLLAVISGIFFLKFADYPILLALGFSLPHNMPLPLIWAMPTYFIILSLCIAHKIVCLSTQRDKSFKFGKNISIWIFLFFGWVFFRYLQDPALPRLFASSDVGVTGFKSFFGYFACLVYILFLPILIDTKERFIKFLRWMAIFALFFISVLSIGSLTSSYELANIYQSIGFTPNYIPGSTLRFVALPNYGFLLISLIFLRDELRLRKVHILFMMGFGVTALVLGSNRTTILQLFAFIILILMLRGKIIALYASLVIFVSILSVFYYVGENYTLPTKYQFVRVLSIASPKVSRETDAMSNIHWRLMRWERALEDIKENPVLGVGYGGMEGIFRLLSYTRIDEDMKIEMDLATGSSHNTLISGARALGIPAVVLFLAVWYVQVYYHFKKYRNKEIRDDYYHYASWLLPILLSLLISMQASYDLNSIRLWFFVGISELLKKFYFRDKTQSKMQFTGSDELNIV